MNLIIKTTLMWLSVAFMTQGTAQEYLKLQQDGVIYDVDVVVFARLLSQPSAKNINNKPITKNENLMSLPAWNRQQPLLVYPEPVSENSAEWQLPLSEQPKQVDVLSWVILDQSMNHAIVNRLQANPGIKPLFHQKWRQPPSPFTQPQFIEVSTLPATIDLSEYAQEEPNEINYFERQAQQVADYSIDGQVAFSKRKFSHLHVDMNLYRQNSEGETIIYQISQQRQIETGQWQYFDHPQFGVLAKVTQVQLEPKDD